MDYSPWSEAGKLQIRPRRSFSSVGPMKLILCFSESLERGLSDGALKAKVYFWPDFDKIPWAYSPRSFSENGKFWPILNLGFEHTI